MSDQRPDEPLDDLLHEDVPRDPVFELDAVVEAARAAEVRDRRGHGWRILLAIGSVVIASVATVGALRPEWLPFDLPFRDSGSAAPSGPSTRRDTPLRREPRGVGAVLGEASRPRHLPKSVCTLDGSRRAT